MSSPRCNIQSFNTPSREHGERQRVLRVDGGGVRGVRGCGRARVPDLRRGGPPKRRAIEVFPHASAVGAGRRPAAERRSRSAPGARASCCAQGVRTDELTSIDRIDAALAALTGLLALDGQTVRSGRPDRGRHRAAGEHAAGHPVPPGRRTRPSDAAPLFHYCALRRSGCDQAWCAGEFAPGHDAKRKACCGARAREGRAAIESWSERGWKATSGDAVDEPQRFETRAIHAGQEPERSYGVGERPDLPDRDLRARRRSASRSAGTTRAAATRRARRFQLALAALEGGAQAFAFASGMAAETTLLLTLRPGDHVVLADDVYGGTYRLLSRGALGWGLTFTTVDLADPWPLARRARDPRPSSCGSRRRRTRC